MKNDIIELDFDDKNFPSDASMSLWIGNTATSNNEKSIEFYISGILNMQGESLDCTLSREDALKLANTLLEALKD